MVYLKFIDWLRYKLAGNELEELWRLKHRVREVGTWCSYDKKVVAISKYLIDMHDYPCQSRGAYGSIDDFREYLKTLGD